MIAIRIDGVYSTTKISNFPAPTYEGWLDETSRQFKYIDVLVMLHH